MIRPVAYLGKLALIAAGGSFLSSGPALAAPAEQPAAAAAPSADRGARMNIAPLRLEFDATKNANTVMVTNTSSRPLAVQTRLFAWSQQAGEDVYAPSSDLTVSPSIIAIAPGATQIVRVMRVGTPSPGEKRFRLAVDQLPDPSTAQGGEAEARLRFTLPLFMDRDKAQPAALAWRLSSGKLELVNSGGQTVRVVGLEVSKAGGAIVPVERNSLRYVQGQSAISWGVPNACALGAVTVKALIDGQPVNAQVSPTCG